MNGSDEIFVRAVRAAAAVTGVLKRGAAVGLGAGALVLAGCSGPTVRATPENRVETAAQPIDAGAPDAPLCSDDPGWGSDCCRAAEAAGHFVAACQAWGPPAPPAYRGEVLA